MKKWRDREEFKSRVLEWAGKMDVKARAVYVRPMTTKWASCSTAGTLSFNDELLDLDRDLGDYVIVHELLHFSVPNHGRLWKSLMRAHLGDYEALEQRLPRKRVFGERQVQNSGTGLPQSHVNPNRGRHPNDNDKCGERRRKGK